MAGDHTPRRVVCLQPSASVIMHAIGKLDRVVACTKYCAEALVWGRGFAPPGRVTDPPPHNLSRTELAIVADSWTAQSAQILAAKPDLVIAAVPYQEKAVAEILKSGARFLGLAPKTLADIYTDIAAIAGIMGVPEHGERVIADMQREIAMVRAQADGRDRPRVFCEEWGKPLIASQKWVAELVEAAGGRFAGETGVQRPPEAVLREEPDVLIAAWCGAGDRVPLEKIVRERGWGDMRAVKEGRVYGIRDEFLNTPAPTLLLGLHALAAAIHPECFPHVTGLKSINDLRGQVSEDPQR